MVQIASHYHKVALREGAHGLKNICGKKPAVCLTYRKCFWKNTGLTISTVLLLNRNGNCGLHFINLISSNISLWCFFSFSILSVSVELLILFMWYFLICWVVCLGSLVACWASLKQLLWSLHWEIDLFLCGQLLKNNCVPLALSSFLDFFFF